jgi:hypothetical protein
MRDTVGLLFPDTCNVLSVSYSSDGQGGNVETWGTVTANQACRLDAATSKGGFLGQSDAVSGASIQESTRWILSLPHNTTVTKDNKIECNSLTFNITAVDVGKSWNASVRAILEVI